MSQRQATRAEIAAATGLSKPTVSESVRRLSASGSVVDTGERTTGRGRVGTYYALPATTGRALVAEPRARGDRGRGHRRLRPGRRAVAGPGDPLARRRAGRADAATRRRRGRGRAVPARGRQRRRSRGPGERAARRAAGLAVPARRARRARRPGRAGRRSRHRRQRRQLGGPCRAQPRRATASGTSSTCSSAKASDAPSSPTERSGAATPAWPARSRYVVTAGPDGVAMRLTDVFDALGLRRPGTAAIDVPALLHAVEPDTTRPPKYGRAGTRRGRRALGRGGADRSGGRAGRRPVGSASERAGGGGSASSRTPRSTSRSRPPP